MFNVDWDYIFFDKWVDSLRLYLLVKISKFKELLLTHIILFSNTPSLSNILYKYVFPFLNTPYLILKLININLKNNPLALYNSKNKIKVIHPPHKSHLQYSSCTNQSIIIAPSSLIPYLQFKQHAQANRSLFSSLIIYIKHTNLLYHKFKSPNIIASVLLLKFTQIFCHSKTQPSIWH